MKTVLKFTLPAAILMAFAAGGAPHSFAQSNDDVEGRLSRMEDQMQQLMGQVEQLTFEVRRLQGQRKSSALDQPVQQPPQTQQKKRQAVVEDPAAGQGVEQIEGDTQYTQQPLRTVGDNEELPEGAVQKAPGPKILGTLPSSDYQSGSGANGQFQGQVLVPPANGSGGDEVQSQVLVPSSGGNGDDQVQGRVLVAPSNNGAGGQVLVPPASANGDDVSNDLVPEKVESVSLGGSATGSAAGGDPANGDPEAIYERSYESLLRRQFSDAEVGFRSFLDQHRDHSLAGNAQYWLGETYYVQGDYKQAAQAFLSGYRDFPKSRKAADSLLKLGLSLNRLGQKEQACAAYTQVGSQFPKAAEARKRAQSEIKRAGC